MKSIKFNSEMVNAILDGRKTQTRIVFNNKEGFSDIAIEYIKFLSSPYGKIGDKVFVKEDFVEGIDKDSIVNEDELDDEDINPEYEEKTWYRATDPDLRWTDDYDCFIDTPWKSAHYMKQEQSRITLEITDIKVERLKDISEEDAIEEGIFFTDYGYKCYHGYANIKDCPSKVGHDNRNEGWSWKQNKSHEECLGSSQMGFANLWNKTHKKDQAKQWNANPFVWVITFKVIK